MLTATDPAADSLTLEKPFLGLLGDNDEAGRVFLVLDYQTTPPPPRSAPKRCATPSRRPHPRRTQTAGDTPAPGGQPVTTGSSRWCRTSPRRPSTPPPPAKTSTSHPYYTVPDGVASVRITAAGGAGAAGTTGGEATSPGGLGGIVSETFQVTPGEIL